MNEYELVGEKRPSVGTRASRRLRRAGRVPAILYGAGEEPLPFWLNAAEVRKRLENEAFMSHILSVKIDGLEAQAVLKDVQRDPVSSEVNHMDLQRISAEQEITMHVPLHFTHEDKCPGKRAGGIITRLVVEVEVRCLPKDLPEYLEVDLSSVEIGDTIHLSELPLPEGVELVALQQGEEYDQALVSVQHPRVEVEEVEAVEEGEFDEEISKLVEAGEEEEEGDKGEKDEES